MQNRERKGPGGAQRGRREPPGQWRDRWEREKRGNKPRDLLVADLLQGGGGRQQKADAETRLGGGTEFLRKEKESKNETRLKAEIVTGAREKKKRGKRLVESAEKD